MTNVAQRPEWVRDAVFYQIFPDRFRRSGKVRPEAPYEAWTAPPTPHGYKGGDLFGVVERLGWIQDLGVTALYLNPIFRSASNHRYHTHDFYVVDPILGGDAAFEALLHAVHQRGMRIVLDGVFNHVGRGFFPFNDLLENGESSPWRQWFRVKSWPVTAYDESKPPPYPAWWGLHALPKLDTDQSEVREYLMQVGEHWVDRGIDGWRLDVPNEIQTPGFWEEFRQRTRARNPEIYLLGEIWEAPAQWIADGTRFDGTMNYQLAGRIISFAAQKCLDPEVVVGVPYPILPELDAPTLRRDLLHMMAAWPFEATCSNLELLGSHDTPRLETVMGGDDASVRLALTLLFAFPGPPCLYYGDEIGLRGGKDPDCRRAFPWDQPETWNLARLHTIQELTALRRRVPALRRGSVQFPVVDSAIEAPRLFALLREHAEGSALVLLNAGSHPASASILGLEPAQGRRWVRAFGHGTVHTHVAGSVVTVPARAAGIFLMEPTV